MQILINNLLQNSTLNKDQIRQRLKYIDQLGIELSSSDEAKRLGAIFTPYWLADRVTKNTLSYFRKLNPGCSNPSKVGDLSCGLGVFVHYLNEYTNSNSTIYGIEKSKEYFDVANRIFSFDKNIKIELGDSLLDSQFKTYKEKFDVIVGNPPYVRSQLLDSSYSSKLKKDYPDITQGNFDLVILFIDHAIRNLKDGGVCSLIVSNKFLSSKYGKTICEKLRRKTRILEITNFGDNQVFPGRTTYSCVITFSKMKPNKRFKLITFPPGLDWGRTSENLKLADEKLLPLERLNSFPWDLSASDDKGILNIIQNAFSPSLMDYFPVIFQGIRTGANNVFVIDKTFASNLEEDLLRPLIGGENIKKCEIIEPDKFVIWPYQRTKSGDYELISEAQFTKQYPKVWKYLVSHKKELIKRSRDVNSAWYGFSRIQNLNQIDSPKIIVKEMMHSAEFAVDTEGKYVISSGYALVPHRSMGVDEIKLWAAILSTDIMEFQLRHCATHLHSGWFRVLKEHLKRVRIFDLLDSDRKQCKVALQKIQLSDEKGWDKLNDFVAQKFELNKEKQLTIKNYLEAFHSVSKPKKKKELKDDDEVIKRDVEISEETKRKYYPVELPQYYKFHVSREDLSRLVTFQGNKDMPVHNWFKYTQGFSNHLVKELISEFNVQKNEVVYDPFCGAGTTLLACKELGIKSFGTEISPLLSWISKLKITNWKIDTLKKFLLKIKKVKFSKKNGCEMLFQDFLNKAYPTNILAQINWLVDWIDRQSENSQIKDFAKLVLISILEEVSHIRKHGSHYRFLNNVDNIGVLNLNIELIDSNAEIKPIYLKKFEAMISDLERIDLKSVNAEVFTMDSRKGAPKRRKFNHVITSPPYLNRNNYIAQQKAELSLLGLINNYENYRRLTKSTFRSHVESELSKEPICSTPEINKIISKIDVKNLNNNKVLHMICGYFDDLKETLNNIKKSIERNGKVAFVLGNSRWGGVVIPVDHIFALLAEREGFKVKNIFVTRHKGNSPQQMKKFGKIPLRESIVILQN